MVNTDGWSERKKTLYSCLKRAFDKDDGARAILQVQWLKARVAHENQAGAALMKAFNHANADEPRAVRALNLIEKKNGRNVFYTDESAGLPPMHYIQ